MRSRHGQMVGALAAAVALVITSLLDALVGSIPSLLGAVAQGVIRIAPGPVSQNAIDVLGQTDKPALRVGTILIALLIGAAAGDAAARRAWIGDATFAVFGALGVVAVAAQDGIPVGGAVVSGALGALGGAQALRWLLPRPEQVLPEIAVPGQGIDRRRFLSTAGFVAVAAGGARVVGSASEEPIDPALAARFGPPVAKQGLAVAGLSPLITPNDAFYRTDEALIIPRVNADRWRLRVRGLVNQSLELNYNELLAMPQVDADVTLACVSNEVGGTLVGHARWQGVRLDSLLERAGVRAGADQVVGRSVDGFTAGFPLSVLDGRDALVAVAMNGEVLPPVHGFPARLVVPGLYGYVSATKWLREIELTTFDAFEGYWIRRGWSRLGPVKVASRIDVPRDGSSVKPGERMIAGVAWAPHRGIEAIEVRVDNGAWLSATLGEALSQDAWRQWTLPWTATTGRHVIEVRATTSDGETQTAQTTDSFPDGATGHHRVRIEVD